MKLWWRWCTSYHIQSFVFFLVECEAIDSNKLEKTLVDILSDIQTPQLHQQVNTLSWITLNNTLLFKISQFRIFPLFIIFNYYNCKNSEQTLKKANKMDSNLPIIANKCDLKFQIFRRQLLVLGYSPRQLMAVENAVIGWDSEFRVCLILKSALE